ncbi:MAG: response regulator transcription factor [Cyclobacteriaceae bacterium]
MHFSKPIILFSCLIALLAIGLQYLQYQYWIRSLSTEVYAGIIAFLFMVLGLWLGSKWGFKKRPIKTISTSTTVPIDLAHKFGLSKREIEVLQLISDGYSNQEIADRLYVSLSTVKTHVSNVFSKLDVQRRTQAVRKVQEMRLFENT